MSTQPSPGRMGTGISTRGQRSYGNTIYTKGQRLYGNGDIYERMGQSNFRMVEIFGVIEN